MTEEQKYELKSRIWHNRILNINELKDEIDKYTESDSDTDWTAWEILDGMEWSTCDKCGDLWFCEELYWIEGLLDENDPEDKIILDNLAKEPYEYCALCDKCLSELRKEKK